ncbi:MAG TPA: SEC-C metal-binding domain-containing protein [Steroidobacteraceae bacterium]|nr:SEC-C metal-binding domain-containing protein [Steroidobacteraceae bacterium]
MEDQLLAKQRPYNAVRGYANGQLWTPSKVIAVAAGTNLFVGAGFKFVVDDEQLLELRRDSAGRLLLTVSLRDADDRVLLSMVDNEWVTGDPLPWDFEYGYNVVKLRRAQRRVALEIDARATPVQITGELWRKGQQFGVSGPNLTFDGVSRMLAFRGIAFVGSSLTADTRTGTFGIRGYGGLQTCMVGLTFKPEQDLRLVTEAFEKLCREAPVDGDAQCPCGSGLKFKECHQPPPHLDR